MRSAALVVALAWLVLVPPGCSGGAAPAADGSGADVAPPDALPDAGPETAWPDSGPPPDGSLPPDVRADGGTRDAAPETVTDAASDTAPETVTDAAPDAGGPWPPFDPTVCGAPPHTWLPRDTVGRVVTWEPTPLLATLTAAQVNGLLAAAAPDVEFTVPYGARNFRLRYVTQDRGALQEATALVGVPVGLPEGERPPIVLYLHGATGAMDDCAPSRNAAEGPLPTTLLASLGYVTVAPDYLGMVGFGPPSPEGTIHSYLVSEPTAVASFDALRAALAATAADPALAQGDPARVLLLGGSQGGHAVFAAERYAPHYAPELGVLGAVALAPPSDLLGLTTWVMDEPGLPARSLAAALTAMWSWYGRTVPLSGALTDEEPHHLATAVPEWMATGCDGVRVLNDLAVAEVFAPGFIAAARSGDWDDAFPWGCLLAENSFAHTSAPRASDTPFLMVMGENDELVAASVERADVAALCADGYDIEYIECAGGGHSIGAVEMVFYALDWMEDRLAGAPLGPDTCVVRPPMACEGL